MYFNIPFTSPESAANVQLLVLDPLMVNKGHFLQKCTQWFEANFPGYTAFMTTSCTRALELSALALQISPGDEVILSPFNYVGVGNAFANYGAKLVYVDIDPGTMNIDAGLVEAAITPRTKAVVAMHYAAVPCEIEKITDICARHKIACIEDNAQGIGVYHNGKPLGAFSDYSAISFDTLKNISCNEGGVLLCRNELAPRVEIAFSNGSNRTAFMRGEVKKYEWVSRGSKFTMNEYTAAVLYPLLQSCEQITQVRKKKFDALFEKIGAIEALQQYIPQCMLETAHNGHIAYLKFEDTAARDRVMKFMNAQGVPCAFHYVPLDQSAAGMHSGISPETCVHSAHESSVLLRLPVHHLLAENDMDRIADTLQAAVVQSVIS